MITLKFIANNDPKALGSATISSKTGKSLMQAAQSGAWTALRPTAAAA
jgi:hypothetical protein